MRYRDFQILIGEKLPNGYRVRVLASSAGEGEGLFAIEPDSLDIQEILRRMDAGDVDEEFLKSLGGRGPARGHEEFYLFGGRRFSQCRIG